MTARKQAPVAKAAPSKAVAVLPAAPVAKKVPAKKIVAPKVEATTVDLSARVESARSAGFSRRFLTEESGLTGTTALYRVDRMGKVEAAKLAEVLVKIESGAIPAPTSRTAAAGRPGRQHKIEEAARILALAYQSKSLADARKGIAEAQEMLKN